MSGISLYKLEPTTPFESAHQFTLARDSKPIPGCHYSLCSSHSFVLTDSLSGHICAYCDRGQRRFSSFGDWSPSLTVAYEFDSGCFFSSCHHSKFSLMNAQHVCFTQYPRSCVVVALDLVVKTQVNRVVKTQACAVWLFSTLLLSSKGKFHTNSSARLHVSRQI